MKQDFHPYDNTSKFQSDHCGIEINNNHHLFQQHYLFQSDHCGIEIKLIQRRLRISSMFQSDHCGIEIYPSIFISISIFRFNRTIVELKCCVETYIRYIVIVFQSDHCGIEIVVVFPYLILLHMFQSDHCGIEIYEN